VIDLAQIIQLHKTLGDQRLREQLASGCPAVEVTSRARQLADALHALGANCITLADRNYPERIRLLLADEAPPVLYYFGNLALLDQISISIIGTRRPTADGRKAAISFAAALADARVAVTSGNAPGIDAAAHATAISSGGTTVCFPPVPLDQFEPAFAPPPDPKSWLVMSPFVPGSPVQPWNFLARNALVAAQAGAALIAETGTRGGTLNTVQHLRRLRRPMFCVRLPKGARHAKSHAMLAAAGAEYVPPSAGPEAMQSILSAAQQPLVRVEPSRDLFEDSEP
jgi:DNA processing protein